jgi:hypothetical protein
MGRKVFMYHMSLIIVDENTRDRIFIIYSVVMMGLLTTFGLLFGIILENGGIFFAGILSAIAFVIILMKIREKGMTSGP